MLPKQSSDTETRPLLRETTHDDTPQRPKESSSARLFVALIFPWLGSFLAALDSTITSTLSATIAADFQSIAIVAWLGSAYLIALTAVQPLSGKLSDIYGRRTGLIFCSICFALGNAICGLAQSKEAIILGRVTAGVGAGGLNSICTYVASDLLSLRQRGIWQGAGMIIFNVGVGSGGLVGGSISDAFGWRWAFLLLTPLTLLSAVGVYFCVPKRNVKASVADSAMDRLRRIDFTGSATLVSALVLLLWVLNLENDRVGGALLSRHTMLAIVLPIVAVLLALFVLIELRYAREPIIPVDLLYRRTVAGASLAMFFFSMTFYTLMFYIPLYFQLRGNTPSKVGVRLIPESIGGAFGSLGTGMFLRATSYCGKIKVLMFVIFLIAPAGFAFSGFDTNQVLPEVYLFTNGLGLGGILTSLTVAILCAVDHQMQAVTTAVVYAFRSTGSTIGVTTSGMLFREVLRMRLRKQNYRGSLDTVLERCNGISSSDPTVCPDNIRAGYLFALQMTFIFALALSACGLLCGLFVKDYELSSTPATGRGDNGREADIEHTESSRDTDERGA